MDDKREIRLLQRLGHRFERIPDVLDESFRQRQVSLRHIELELGPHEWQAIVQVADHCERERASCVEDVRIGVWHENRLDIPVNQIYSCSAG